VASVATITRKGNRKIRTCMTIITSRKEAKSVLVSTTPTTIAAAVGHVLLLLLCVPML